MTALFFLFSFTSCSNNSAPTSENLVAGNTYKTTSAKKGNSANTLTEGLLLPFYLHNSIFCCNFAPEIVRS